MKSGATKVHNISCVAIVLTMAGIGTPGKARDLPCPANTTWREAIHAERTVVDPRSGRRVHGHIEEFSNAWLAVVDEGGQRAGLLRMTTGAPGISLTFGIDRPRPADFGEIMMAVESPMGDGSWPRMKRPCDMRDGSVMAFSEKDLPGARGTDAGERPRFHGVLKRQGLWFSYRMTFAAEGAEPGFSYGGRLRYGTPDKAYDLGTDMQGWHVYRDDRFVRTIPAGARVPLSAVLRELGSGTPLP